MRTVGQCHEGRCLGIEGHVEGPLPNVFAPLLSSCIALLGVGCHLPCFFGVRAFVAPGLFGSSGLAEDLVRIQGGIGL